MSALETQFNAVEKQLREIRSIVDEIDGTQFGDLNRLFDKLSKQVDESTKGLTELSHLIDWDAA